MDRVPQAVEGRDTNAGCGPRVDVPGVGPWEVDARCASRALPDRDAVRAVALELERETFGCRVLRGRLLLLDQA